ncbi:N-acetyl-alpha-D-glucosaminyl L-malate synthase BshA [Anaerobranca gottschalkii]|uniref:N-acetyl-alpha-D-glucosaminyl L-malate synthase BshA n=1 Tax=Anaerobranca gottschalkii DSM 13577 TaxID=1120990 RepID=A0A1H9ZSQ7_9FIRM|nr:N-acetyl-alpha-D-glucosaminyl L-malate synthase BshA [Anaerobranca gottschalkii]SES83842.1 N-acetyl-alpha-D-glucosaminyl L-malate synthase BshA [Anaerobranca gottschalkii DSM 13577]
MLKIGITCYPSYGGSGAMATELGKTLADKGHIVHFINYEVPFRLNGYHQRIVYHHLEIPTYPLFKYPPYTLALASRIAEVALNEKLDIIHAHYAIPHSICGYLAKLMVPNLKLVTTLHGTDITLVGNDQTFFPITKFAIEASDGVTAVSQSLKEDTYKIFDIKRDIQVIYNFVDTASYKRERNSKLVNCLGLNGKKVVIHISNFRPVKRITDVIEIFKGISEKVDSVLLMIGDGVERSKAEKLTAKYNLDVRFLGQQANIIPFLSVADLLLLPSEQESFGLVALEAMACNVPVVGSKVGGLPEVIKDGDNGYLVEVGNIGLFVQKSLAILTNDNLREIMGNKGRERAVKYFDQGKIIKEYEEFYYQILKG